MFSKSSIGVPQFYPRDLKKRVDEYVVGQERAKKTLSSVIFNHYQNLRRRQYQEEQERKRDEKLMRQTIARDRFSHDPPHDPVEDWQPARTAGDSFQDAFVTHNDFTQHIHQPWQQQKSEQTVEFYIPEDADRQPAVKIDKSNILLIGPTGVGKTYILE